MNDTDICQGLSTHGKCSANGSCYLFIETFFFSYISSALSSYPEKYFEDKDHFLFILCHLQLLIKWLYLAHATYLF